MPRKKKQGLENMGAQAALLGQGTPMSTPIGPPTAPLAGPPIEMPPAPPRRPMRKGPPTKGAPKKKGKR